MNRRRRRMLHFLGLLAVAYVGLLVLVFCFQRRLIYLPTRLAPMLAQTVAGRSGCTAFPAVGAETLGWRLPATSDNADPVLIFHGNAGCALDRTYLAEPIHTAKSNDVIVVEYPGYGAREGNPNLNSLLATAEAALAALPTNQSVILVSESLGAGAAAHLAKLHPNRIRGLVMFVPYDDLGEVAQGAFPFLPAKWLLRDRFRPAAWLHAYRGPIQFVLAGADEVIPTRRGQALYDAYAGPKRLQLVKGARHNEVAAQSPEWWREVFAFLELHPLDSPE